MGTVKRASGGEMGQDMTTRHIARLAAAIVVLLAVSSAQAELIYVDAANCPGPTPGSIAQIFPTGIEEHCRDHE